MVFLFIPYAGEQEVLMVEWVFMRATGTKKNIVAAITNFLAENGTQQTGPPLK